MAEDIKNEIQEQINSFLKNKYKNNLAAILIFGSYFTGNYDPEESDLDLIILLKNKNPKEKDKIEIKESLKKLNVFVHHLKTIKKCKEDLYEKGSWSSWIVLQKGARVIFSTPEFKDFQKYLKENPIKKEKLIEFIKKKDDFDLIIDLQNKKNFDATKMLFAHIRRKLQIIHYHRQKIIEPDYNQCLKSNAELNKNKLLIKLGKSYLSRESMRKKELSEIVSLSRKLTPKTIKTISS